MGNDTILLTNQLRTVAVMSYNIGIYDINNREISVGDNIVINIYDACYRPMPLIVSKNCTIEVNADKLGVFLGTKEEFTPLSGFSWNVTFEIIF